MTFTNNGALFDQEHPRVIPRRVQRTISFPTLTTATSVTRREIMTDYGMIMDNDEREFMTDKGMFRESFATPPDTGALVSVGSLWKRSLHSVNWQQPVNWSSQLCKPLKFGGLLSLT